MDEVKEGQRDNTGAGLQGAEGRVGSVQEVLPEPDAERADTAGAEAVHEEQRPVTVQQHFLSGQLVGTPGGIKTAAEAAEMAGKPVLQFKTHGKINSQQGVHMPPKASAAYTCGDCLDLERRLRIAFKSMGFEF